MAEIVKIKVSSLTEAVSLDNLVVLGVDGANNSVKVPILLLKGNKGDNGTEIELQKSSTHLQWRYVGGSWVDLVALADLKGVKGDTGANIELQKSATHLQWRVSGTATWNDLVSLADLKGTKGDTGEGFIIKGYYNTLSALQLAVTNPNAGDAYGVGNTAPFDIYVYDSVSSAWVNNGALQGPAGASSYTYIAYASNDQGADFSLTDGAYIAIKTTTTPIAEPQASDFAGLWKHYKITAAEVAAGIEIGGRNYIKNSEIKTLTGWNSYGTTLSIVDDSLRIVGTSEFVGVSVIYAVALNAQREVTISFYAKNNKDSACDINLFPNGNNPIYVGTLPNNSAWVRLSKTFIPAPYQIDKVNSIGTHIYTTGSIDLQIKYVKIEYGNKVTDWTPAPEDFASASHTHSALYEPAFSKNTAFNKNFGVTAGTVSEGNHTHDLLDFLTSQSTVTTLASLPVTKRVIVASVTAATTLSLAATLEVGRELHIKVYNTSASAITQPLPTSAPFESKKVDGTNISSISIPAGGSAEISILSVTDKYIIKTDA